MEKKQVDKVNRRNMVKMMGALSLGVIPLASSPAQSVLDNEGREVITFLTLQEAKQHQDIKDGTIVQTLGYYKLNDGGGASYYVTENEEKQTPNEGDIVLFHGGLVGVLLETKQVNYQMFGAKGDGRYDDGVAIKVAHEYANNQGIPVINRSGEYWIEETRGIPIQSSVDFGESVFHINEGLNTKAAVFRVMSRYEAEDIQVDEETKRKIVSAINPGIQVLPELKEYKNSLIVVVDEDDRIGFRAGARYEGQSWAREEFFYLEEDGRVIGDIAWSFKNYTSLMAYPAEQSYLVIEGGTFYLSGDNHPDPERKGYFQNGFSVTRSRTIIKNQWVGLEKGKSDIAFNPRNGFYTFNSVYDITLENVRLVPWEQDRPGTDRDLYAGTYGIGARRMLNSTFRQVTAEGTMLHWGVFGTNLNKNFRIEKCQLNRIDVHFHCWNLTIQDSKIGNRGISITGGGDLIIENTTCSSQFFVSFRYDFGAKWDGPIYINNCQLKPNRESDTSLLRFVAGDFDYRYPIGLAEKIHIRDFTFDFSTVPGNDSECWVVSTSAFSKTKHGERLFFPKTLLCDNITVKGREKGVRLIRMRAPQHFALTGRGKLADGVFVPNSIMQFNNIQLEKIIPGENSGFHLQITEVGEDDYDESSLFPEIYFGRCENLFLDLDGAVANVLVENCSVSQLYAGNGQGLQGEITLSHCQLTPILVDKTSKPYQVNATLGTNFINCTFHLPRLDGELQPTLFGLVEIIKLNDSVKYNHVNTRLGKDVLGYLGSELITLRSKFIHQLQSNYEL